MCLLQRCLLYHACSRDFFNTLFLWWLLRLYLESLSTGLMVTNMDDEQIIFAEFNGSRVLTNLWRLQWYFLQVFQKQIWMITPDFLVVYWYHSVHKFMKTAAIFKTGFSLMLNHFPLPLPSPALSWPKFHVLRYLLAIWHPETAPYPGYLSSLLLLLIH